MKYQELLKDDNLEIRLYPSTKRTIVIGGRYYFLQFPSIIATKVNLSHQPADFFKIDDVLKNPCCFLAVHFVINNKVYKIPLYQVNHIVDGWGVCIIEGSAHGLFKPNKSLDHLLTLFWTSGFAYRNRALYWGISYHDWEKMNLKEVHKAAKARLPCLGTCKGYIKKLQNLCAQIKLKKPVKDGMTSRYID